MTRLIFATVCTVALCMISSASYAQSEINVSKNEFGISLGFNRSLPRADFKDGTGIIPGNAYSVESGNGFGLGVVYQRMLSDKFHLRAQPTISFSESQVFLNGLSFSEGLGKREAVLIELPVNIVFEDVNKKIGPSLSMGAKYGYDLAAGSLTRGQNPNLPLNITPQLSLDISLGLRCHFKYFNFKPEIVYSRGFVEQTDLPAVPRANYDNFNMDQLALRLVFYGDNWKKNS